MSDDGAAVFPPMSPPPAMAPSIASTSGGVGEGGGGGATSAGMASPSPSPSDASRAIDFLALTRKLKTTRRTGWVRAGVSNPESIADHMYRMSLMAMIASRPPSSTSTSTSPPLDADRCIRLAIVHDLAECLVGDITPYCGVSDEDKHDREMIAMERLRDVLGRELGGDEFVELWREYEGGTTLESKLVKDLDKIEMILQAMEYENENDPNASCLDSFFDGTDGIWRTDIGRDWAMEIVSRRRRRPTK